MPIILQSPLPLAVTMARGKNRKKDREEKPPDIDPAWDNPDWIVNRSNREWREKQAEMSRNIPVVTLKPTPPNSLEYETIEMFTEAQEAYLAALWDDHDTDRLETLTASEIEEQRGAE